MANCPGSAPLLHLPEGLASADIQGGDERPGTVVDGLELPPFDDGARFVREHHIDRRWTKHILQWPVAIQGIQREPGTKLGPVLERLETRVTLWPG
jgi:hypothetical protein